MMPIGHGWIVTKRVHIERIGCETCELVVKVNRCLVSGPFGCQQSRNPKKRLKRREIENVFVGLHKCFRTF